MLEVYWEGVLWEDEWEHVLCSELCLPVSKNIIECELIRKRSKRTEEPIKPNRPYDWASCYLCSKELRGAGKHGVVKFELRLERLCE